MLVGVAEVAAGEDSALLVLGVAVFDDTDVFLVLAAAAPAAADTAVLVLVVAGTLSAVSSASRPAGNRDWTSSRH